MNKVYTRPPHNYTKAQSMDEETQQQQDYTGKQTTLQRLCRTQE